MAKNTFNPISNRGLQITLESLISPDDIARFKDRFEHLAFNDFPAAFHYAMVYTTREAQEGPGDVVEDIRPRGVWVEGTYPEGDVVTVDGSAYYQTADDSEDFETELGAGDWELLAAAGADGGGGGGGGSSSYPQLQAAGMVTTWSRQLCGAIATEACELVAAKPIVGTACRRSALGRPTSWLRLQNSMRAAAAPPSER